MLPEADKTWLDPDYIEAGRLVHELLQQWDLREDLLARWDRLCEALQLREKVRHLGREALANFLRSPVAQWMQEGEILRETQFARLVDGNPLVGKPDLLIQFPDRWIVVDFKIRIGDRGRKLYQEQVRDYLRILEPLAPRVEGFLYNLETGTLEPVNPVLRNSR